VEQSPIACAIVDKLEVACLYHYELCLHLPEGQLEGEALDLTRNDDGEECLRLKAVEEIRDVPLRQIVMIEAITENPYFSRLTLNKSGACH
jgi:transcriptional antiterminator Rof (Rho-off)